MVCRHPVDQAPEHHIPHHGVIAVHGIATTAVVEVVSVRRQQVVGSIVDALEDNGTQTTGETVFYLADYRSENSDEHFALSTWEWFDLSSLGVVTRVEFSLFTTKSDEYGFTTPTYFCLDNFGAETPVETDLEKVQKDDVQSTKVLINGQIFVLRGDKIYDLNGRLIR